MKQIEYGAWKIHIYKGQGVEVFHVCPNIVSRSLEVYFIAGRDMRFLGGIYKKEINENYRDLSDVCDCGQRVPARVKFLAELLS